MEWFHVIETSVMKELANQHQEYLPHYTFHFFNELSLFIKAGGVLGKPKKRIPSYQLVTFAQN